MHEREELVAAVRGHLARIAALRDPSVALELLVLADARRLERFLRDRAREPRDWLELRGVEGDHVDDLEAHLALGLLLGAACHALPAHERERQLKATVHTLTPCFLAGYRPLPPQFLPFLAEESEQLAVALARSAHERRTVDQVVPLLRDITAALPPGHPARRPQLVNLGSVLIKRFLLTDAMEDREAALRTYHEAAAGAPPADRSMCLYSLAVSLRSVFQRTGEPSELDLAAAVCEEALSAEPMPRPEVAVTLANLSTELTAHAVRSSSTAALQRAVDLSGRAVTATVPRSPQHVHCLYAQAFNRLTRFHQTGSADDLAVAESIYRKIKDTAPRDSPYRVLSRSDLGTVLLNRFKLNAVRPYLDDAISLQECVLAVFPLDHDERWRVLVTLGEELRERFADSNNPQDVARAVTLAREAVALTPVGHQGRPAALMSLGMALRVRHEWQVEYDGQGGLSADLDEAIELQQEALTMAPAESWVRAGRLSDLGTSLIAKFQITGDLESLDQAVRLTDEAVAATGREDPERGVRLYNLATALLERCQRLRGRADLDWAVEVAEELVGSIPVGNWARPRAASTSSRAFYLRFLHAKAAEDLTRAIVRAEETVTITPGDAPERARWLMNLAMLQLERFHLTQASRDVDSAVASAAGAVAALGPGPRPDRPGCLNTQAAALLTRYRLAPAVGASDLRNADESLREALAALPGDHPQRAGMLINRANILASAPGRRAAAINAYIAAARVVTAPPSMRVHAARAAATLLAASAPAKAAGLLALAVSLLPSMVPRQLHRGDQQTILKDVAELANDAAALTLMARPRSRRAAVRALSLLEQGRGVLLSQALDARSELTTLEESDDAAHRALAARYLRIRDALDDGQAPGPVARPGWIGSGTRHQDSVIADRHLLNRQFASAISEIRQIPGFETFQRPPRVREFLAEAAHGPVVVFNVSEYGCGALLIADGKIKHVPLHGLIRAQLIDEINVFHSGLRTIGRRKPQGDDTERLKEWSAERRAAQDTLSGVLKWLWEVVAEPVLTALGFDGSEARRGQRIWWATGGLLGLLPLHAAGQHRKAAHPDGDDRRTTVMDRVVSSYTPTVRALRYARRPVPERLQTDGSVDPPHALIVAMPNTPHASPLPHVLTEAQQLRRQLPRHTLLMEGSGSSSAAQPTTASVRAALPRCAIAHFACHGSVHPSDPSLSKLLLCDPADPLTVSSLASLRLDGARLAYLSACDTAAVVPNELIDEAIHLTSAFQLAGFRHVVGTLWTINDLVGARIAEAFYARAVTGSTALTATRDSNHDVASALHDAVLAVRSEFPNRPSLWASYIHSGA
ncbi:CHAT domain-containing protein [Streptomyces canus]|uniref:CHAT domain-containing protein n=1 Tax=Streptomyces canus TaxID=58343 RepID=UPI002E2B0551|nr:CHAT domain-containing protein [Streptomyces canus]